VSGFVGVNKLRRTLRRLEPEVTKGVKYELARGAQAIKDDAVRNFRAVDIPEIGTGDLKRSISYQISRDGLTAVIGPEAKRAKLNKGIFSNNASKNTYKTKPAKAALWNIQKGYWVEFGTKGVPKLNIPQMPARPFMNPAWDTNKDKLREKIRAEVAKALGGV
jgi:HK97 gp10 family phage protein